jgi:hypothetical protein
MEQYTLPPPPRRKRQCLVDTFQWWAAWAVPGLGMFSEGAEAGSAQGRTISVAKRTRQLQPSSGR